LNRATCSVSPIIFLYRIGALEWLPKIFDEIWMPSEVLDDLLEARFIGYDVPSPFNLPWVQYQDPQLTIPAAWMSLDLSSGEVAAMSLAFENPNCIVLLDEPLGRRAAKAVGIQYWGTLKILLEAKQRGLTDRITPYVDRLGKTGLWIMGDTRRRILHLAGEDEPEPKSEPAPAPAAAAEPATSPQSAPPPEPPTQPKASDVPTKPDPPAPA
jgi:predicted nucleic acid-binding protein